MFHQTEDRSGSAHLRRRRGCEVVGFRNGVSLPLTLPLRPRRKAGKGPFLLSRLGKSGGKNRGAAGCDGHRKASLSVNDGREGHDNHTMGRIQMTGWMWFADARMWFGGNYGEGAEQSV
jgi:hypothetical protein